MPRRLSILAGLSLLQSSVTATAIDLPFEDNRFSLQGFGTLGIVHSSNDKATFIRDKTQPDGPHGGGFMWETDSRLGLQANWRATDKIETMLQVVSKYRYDGSYRPQLTWAFLKYNFTPEVWMRVGRLGFDIYLNAESRDVGYAYLWVRPPVDTYGQAYYSYTDGFDLNFSHALGEGIFLAKIYAGKLDETVPARKGLEYEVDGSIWGAQLKYQTLNWLLTTGFGVVHVENDYSSSLQLMQALRMTGVPAAIGVADRLSLTNDDFVYTAAGLAYDNGPLQSTLGFNHIHSSSLAYPSSWSGSWMLGYRIGKWTPFAGYSRVKSDHPKANTGLPNYPMLAAINRGVDYALRFNQIDQDTVTLGARFDFTKNAALKMQADWINSRDNPSTLWLDPEPDWNGRSTVLSVSLDFVF